MDEHKSRKIPAAEMINTTVQVTRKRSMIPQSESNILRLRFPDIYSEIDFDNNQESMFQYSMWIQQILDWICKDTKCDHHKYKMAVYSRTSKKQPGNVLLSRIPNMSMSILCTLVSSPIRELDYDRLKDDPETIPPGSRTVLHDLFRKLRTMRSP